jgi:electron transfer flavoprotein alpha subunit
LDTCGPAESEEEASSSQHHHHPQAKKKKTKIQSQKERSKSCTTKLHKSKKIVVLAACSKLKRKRTNFAKYLQRAMQVTRENAECNNNNNNKRRWVGYKDQRRFLKVDPRGGGRKEGRKEEE